MAIKRTVRTDFCEISVREKGIVHVRTFPNVEIGSEEAKEYHTLMAYMTQSAPHVTILDINGVVNVHKEARNVLIGNSNEWGKTLAVALVSSSLASRVLGNFFLTVKRPKYPIKMFAEQTEATFWARDMYNKTALRAAS